MTGELFDRILKTRLAKISAVLASKGAEYASAEDRLYNFKRAGAILRKSPKEALLGMLVKHLVSVIDIVESDKKPSPHLIDEKVGDAINYLILLEALLIEYSGVDFAPSPTKVDNQEATVRI